MDSRTNLLPCSISARLLVVSLMFRCLLQKIGRAGCSCWWRPQRASMESGLASKCPWVSNTIRPRRCPERTSSAIDTHESGGPRRMERPGKQRRNLATSLAADAGRVVRNQQNAAYSGRNRLRASAARDRTFTRFFILLVGGTD